VAKLCDSDERQLVFLRKSLELQSFRRGTIIVQNLADDTGRMINARQVAPQIRRCLGMTDSLKNSAFLRAQWKKM